MLADRIMDYNVFQFHSTLNLQWCDPLYTFLLKTANKLIFLDMLASTVLCLILTCLFKFRFALNSWLHSGQFTFAWSCWCFSCWWWLRKDLGFSWHAPTKHIHWPGLADAVCILLLLQQFIHLKGSNMTYDVNFVTNVLCLKQLWRTTSVVTLQRSLI